MPLDPFEIAGRFEGVELLTPAKFEEIVGRSCVEKLFVRCRDMWSGFVVPVDGKNLIVINHTHAATRKAATLAEELFHIFLGHRPTKISPCPLTGMLRREYSKETENEAYWSAAAALLPYIVLKIMIESGGTIESIAEHFGVSVPLVEFRLKVTKLWKRK